MRTFDSIKGFGFIRRESGKDVFVFYDDILTRDRVLVEGDKVEFEIENMPKGPRARKVIKIS
ncbi:retron Se72 family effector protein [Marinobacter nauticus]|uniref:retron Se72 family effector protein n=1 Tax=Marinobacter nauticus TaxID=2743 RepID=UPI002AFDDDFB|nr:retron Se72 family effector protein [Marinobacter nauticus]